MSDFPWRLVKSLSSKKERERTGLTVAEGPPSVVSALESETEIQFVAVSESYRTSVEFSALARRLEAGGSASSSRLYVVPDALFERISGTRTPLGVLCVLPWPFRFARGDPKGFWEIPLYLCGVDIQDPGNAGAIIRAAAAAGCGGVWFLGDSADVFAPKCIRSSAGAVFKVRVSQESVATPGSVLKRLGEDGVSVYRAVPRGGEPPWDLDFSGPSAFVVGNEAHGLDADVMGGPGRDVTIPMPGATESLNVALASGMLLYEATRQRLALMGSPAMV